MEGNLDLKWWSCWTSLEEENESGILGRVPLTKCVGWIGNGGSRADGAISWKAVLMVCGWIWEGWTRMRQWKWEILDTINISKQKTHPQHLLMNCYACERLVFVLVAKSYLTLCDPMDCSSQAPLFMGFLRQEYWNGLPFPSPGDLPNPGIKLTSPALAGTFFTTEPLGKPWKRVGLQLK